MIGSPRYIAMTEANEAMATNSRYGKENEVMTSAVVDMAEWRAEVAERKLGELMLTCSRCRTNQCDAMWEEFRVCDECLRILTDKYDRQPAPRPGTDWNAYNRGKADAFREAAQWAQEAMRDGH